MAKQPVFDRSNCPIAVTLDILGDKWTLLVVRDLLLGARRYNDFLESPENIRTNILADRLKRLEEHGLIQKSPYQQKPVRFEYTLTKKGMAMRPLIKQIIKWANEYYPGTYKPFTPGAGNRLAQIWQQRHNTSARKSTTL
jgi:DNA-binding HxlR family transcriptional regulator